MKQLFSLFLFLVPYLALAQYPSNGNQKVTLGEQTTADGLVYRGVLADTGIITPSSDTSAYIILDTVNHRFYNYNRATNVWSVAGGGTAVTTFSAGTTGLTPSTATSGAVTLGGTLAVANGGTNTSTAFTAGSVVFAGSGGTYRQNNTGLYFNNTNKTLSIGKKNDDNNFILDLENSTSDNTILRIKSLNPIASTRLRVQNDSSQFVDFILYGKNTSGTYAGYNYNEIGVFNAGNSHALIGANNTEKDLVFFTEQTNRAVVKSDGEFLIGYTKAEDNGAYRLQVKDSLYVGARVSAAGYTTRSDYNLKDEIKSINYGLNEIMQIMPVSYTYKSNGEHQLGFIAQDIGVIIPESVHFDELMGVDYQSIIPILTKAIQEQTIIIKQLEERIKKLEER